MKTLEKIALIVGVIIVFATFIYLMTLGPESKPMPRIEDSNPPMWGWF